MQWWRSFLLFLTQNTFLGKFSSKILSSQFKLKFSKTKLNMEKVMMIFCFEPPPPQKKKSFLSEFGQKKLIGICKTQWLCSLSLFSIQIKCQLSFLAISNQCMICHYVRSSHSSLYNDCPTILKNEVTVASQTGR